MGYRSFNSGGGEGQQFVINWGPQGVEGRIVERFIGYSAFVVGRKFGRETQHAMLVYSEYIEEIAKTGFAQVEAHGSALFLDGHDAQKQWRR